MKCLLSGLVLSALGLFLFSGNVEAQSSVYVYADGRERLYDSVEDEYYFVDITDSDSGVFYASSVDFGITFSALDNGFNLDFLRETASNVFISTLEYEGIIEDTLTLTSSLDDPYAFTFDFCVSISRNGHYIAEFGEYEDFNLEGTTQFGTDRCETRILDVTDEVATYDAFISLTENGQFFHTNSASIYMQIALPEGVTCTSTSGAFPGCDGDLVEVDEEKQPDDDCAADGLPSTSVGNPINFASGHKYERVIDYFGGNLSFMRRYRSDADWYSGHVGSRWRHNYDRVVASDGSTATVTNADGLVHTFEHDGTDWIIIDDDSHLTASLEETASGFIYTSVSDEVNYFDTSGKLTRLEYRGGGSVNLSYDGFDRLVSVIDEEGQTLSFAYSGIETRIDSMTTPDGVYDYSYDGAGNLTSVLKPDTKTITYHYEDVSFVHALTGITDENNVRFSTYAYDSEGRAVSSEHANGVNNFAIAYNADESVTTTNPLGKDTTYTFETIKGIRRILSVEGHASANCAAANKAYSYDDNGWLTSKTDWEGNVTTYQRDSRGLVTSMIEATGTPEEKTVQYSYEADTRQIDTRTEQGITVDYNYDSDNRLVSQIQSDTAASSPSRSITYSYHPNVTDSSGNIVLGRMASMDGSRTDVSDVTSFVYDASYRLIQTTNALGHITKTLSFDSANRPLITEDANGVQTHFVYDALGRVITSTAAHGTALAATTSYTYDDHGNVLTVTQPNSVTITYVYDDARRLVGMSDALGNSITYTLDNAGNITQEDYYNVSSSLKYTHSSIFDELSRLIESVDANNDSTDYAYDLNSNQTSMTDGNDNTTSYAFDGLDRLVQQTDALSGVTSYALNDLDQNEATTDPRSNTTSYTYNVFGDVLTEVSPDRGTTTYTYDNAGNMLSRTDARGEVVTYTYDALNRVMSTSYASDSSLDQTFTYDSASGCGSSIGRLCSVTDASGSTAYIYDALGRLTDVTETRGSLSFTTSYGYDVAGILTSITLPSGRVIDYTLNANGQINSVSAGGSVIANNITYLPFGGIESMVYDNGVTLTNIYNTAYQLISKQYGSLFNESYVYDDAGHITVKGADNYSYDALNRLTGENGDSFTYDAIGNRLSDALNTYSYPTTSSRLSDISGNAVTLDAAGYTSTDINRDYTFNAAGQLQSLNKDGKKVGTYTYNANNQRTTKIANGQTTHYVYGAGGLLYGEYNAAGNLIREYVWLGNEPIAQIDAPSPTEVIIDNRTHGAVSSNGTWFVSNVSEFQGIDSVHLFNNGLGYFRWHPSLSQTGMYEVSAWWPVWHEAAPRYRDTSAEYNIDHTGPSTNVYVDQNDATLSGQWNSLGAFHLHPYSTVRLNADGSGYVSADAVRFLHLEPTGAERLTRLHSDHLGTPRVGSDDTGASVWSWDSDAFGNGTPTGTAEVNLRFAGQYYDAETDLHYNWNRYYDPNTGRYISSDPIGLGGGLNTFAYVGANPLMFVDPEGLMVCQDDANPADGDSGTIGCAPTGGIGDDYSPRPGPGVGGGRRVSESNGQQCTSGSLPPRTPNAGYTPSPKTLPAFPEATRVKPKSSVQGGGGKRTRWKDSNGRIYEWDARHGTVEIYNKRGKHLGEFDPVTGKQLKPVDPSRSIDP